MLTKSRAHKKGVTVYVELARAVLAGRVWRDGSSYIGKAGDGTVVSLGIVGCEDKVERYLAANPDPNRW